MVKKCLIVRRQSGVFKVNNSLNTILYVDACDILLFKCKEKKNKIKNYL